MSEDGHTFARRSPQAYRMEPKADAVNPALAIAVGHVNVSARDPVSVSEIQAALMADVIPFELRTHVRTLLNETDVETLSDIVRCGVIGYERLSRHAQTLLPADHETRLWLDEHA